MGRRNLDRLHGVEWRAIADTVAEMQARRWDVVSWCPICGVTLHVNLAFVATTMGPAASLWNRQPPCRCVVAGRRCAGRTRFQARPPGLANYVTLLADEPTPENIRRATARPNTRIIRTE